MKTSKKNRGKTMEIIGLLLFLSVSFSSKSLESCLPKLNGGICTCQEFFRKVSWFFQGTDKIIWKMFHILLLGLVEPPVDGRTPINWLFWCKLKSPEDIKGMKNYAHPSHRCFLWYFSSFLGSVSIRKGKASSSTVFLIQVSSQCDIRKKIILGKLFQDFRMAASFSLCL